jgi:carboxymethylenebutenolidase
MHAPPTTGTAVLKGQTIDLGGTRAYVSLPAGTGPFPAIVVIHEWWGLNENIEHWADRLASAGWAAIAVDLYRGTVATTPDEAMQAMKAVDEAKAAATISAALELAKTDPRIRATKRAVIGWCFGGGWSLQTALAHPELDGAIIYYGQLETDPAKLAAIKGKVLGVFGNRDRGIPPATVAKFKAALAEAKVPAEIHQYDAEHAFANPSNPKYDEPSSADAWSHVLTFLQALSR